MYADWSLKDIELIPKNGKTVFSCFACGGGSSMGYKLAGYTIIGINEIDPKLVAVYKANFPDTKYIFNIPIQDFVTSNQFPKDLYNLDVLDGSPPCSSFSMAGNRSKDWGKKKKFREGQSLQVLDDLFFWFIKLAKELRPKVIIAENVQGLLMGEARGYVDMILKAYDEAGYTTQVFLLNSASMGVPQKRRRVFFISTRKDLSLPKVTFSFNKKPITYGEIRENNAERMPLSTSAKALYIHKIPTDNNLGDINRRLYGKQSLFSHVLIKKNKIPNTLTSGGDFIDGHTMGLVTERELVRIQSFPQDYNFLSNSYRNKKYILGMSVPPFMIREIAREVYNKLLL
jgi:DNA (cytosine-5)-methyltransferase 1